MKNKMKFKIGEFSKLCQVTVKTLRYYAAPFLLYRRHLEQRIRRRLAYRNSIAGETVVVTGRAGCGERKLFRRLRSVRNNSGNAGGRFRAMRADRMTFCRHASFVFIRADDCRGEQVVFASI